MAIFAGYTAIFSPGNYSVETVHFLKTHLNLIDEWSSNWRIQINLYREISIPTFSEVKYLGIILDKRLT